MLRTQAPQNRLGRLIWINGSVVSVAAATGPLIGQISRDGHYFIHYDPAQSRSLNGVLVAKDGEHTHARPGRAARRG